MVVQAPIAAGVAAPTDRKEAGGPAPTNGRHQGKVKLKWRRQRTARRLAGLLQPVASDGPLGGRKPSPIAAPPAERNGGEAAGCPRPQLQFGAEP